MNTSSKWFHGTSGFLAEKILKEGFRMNSYEGIWGCAVYLTNKIEEAKSYGETVLFAQGKEDRILRLNYQEDIPSIFPGLSYEEEEACRELREYTLNKGYLASAITYQDGSTHLIVYDTSFFSLIDLDEEATERIA